jgi:ATP-dependent helicase/nuclease subunit B
VYLTPIDRGNVVHEALDRFFGELLRVPGLGRPWTVEQRERLHEILRDCFAGVEARGVTGRRLLWERSCRQLHAQLDLLLDFDGEYRAENGAETIATELEFGRPGAAHPAIVLECSDGRRVNMVGSIDRVDRLAGGGLAVIDYKSGSPRPYTKMTADPLGGGSLLQLPIYAAAARALLDEPRGEPVVASYWFVLRDTKHPRGYPVDAAIEDALDRALRIINDGIDRGIFVANPPEPGWHMWVECPYCDPDGMGTTDSHRQWLRKRDAPELAEYRALLGAGEEES